MSPTSRLFLFTILGACLCCGAAWGEGRTLSPYFVVEGGDPATDRLPLLGTEVSADISGVIADVTVKQTYKNDGTRPIHAKYVFPASTRAAVHGLTLTVGEHRISAKIRERQRAEREFVQAKKAGKNAALLQQQRPNVFSMNVANIMPGQRIDVELRYTELLVPSAGVYEFVYPTVVGPRYSEKPEARAVKTDLWLRTPYIEARKPPTYSLRLEATLRAGMPVDELACPTHPIQTTWEDRTAARIELDPGEGDAGNRDFVLRYRLDGGAIRSGLMLHEGRNEKFFVMMLQPPRQPAIEQVPPREYVFVVDVSGSMNGFPLETAKMLLRDLIGDLRASDTFNVLFFAGGSQLWSPRSMFATQANIDSALAMLDRQRGGGGTRLLQAVKQAMALPRDGVWSRNIVVVTDGFVGTERDVFSYIRYNLHNANVFSFGIGSSVNRLLVEGLARAGMGEPFVVLDPGEASETASRFREYVQFPVLTDIKVAFEGFDAYDVEPASIPDVLAGRPIVVHGKWRGPPAGKIVVSGATGERPYRHAFDVSAVGPSESNGALRYLWARSRIAAISDFSFAGETEQDKDDLVRLGLTYNLLTRHTSFIAVHEIVRNSLGGADEVVQPLPLPRGVGNAAVGTMAYGSEPGLAALVLSALLAASALVVGRRMTWRFP